MGTKVSKISEPQVKASTKISNFDRLVVDDINGEELIPVIKNNRNYVALLDDIGSHTSLSKASGEEINTGTDDIKYTTPKAIADSNILRAEKANQVNGYVQKLSLVNSDAFIVEDSQSSWIKRKVIWSTIVDFIDAFRPLTNNQLKGRLIEKTSIVNEDVFLIENSDVSFSKSFLKWSTIKSILSNTFFGEYSFQFHGLTNKATPVDGDLFVIENSDNSAFNKRKLHFSNIKAALKTYFDTLYNAIMFVVVPGAGIRTNSSVGINEDPSLGRGLTVKGDTGSAIQATFEGPPSSVQPVMVSRATTADNEGMDGIGARHDFYAQNSAGAHVYMGQTAFQMTDATPGSEKFVFYIGVNNWVFLTYDSVTRSFKVQNGSDFEVNGSANGLILTSPNNKRWRVTIDNSGNLITTAL